MNETISVLLNRRSIRKYLPEQIDESDIQMIIKTGLYAPNGGNHQYVRFLVVQNEIKLNEINSMVIKEFAKCDIIEGQYHNKAIIRAKQQDGFHFFYHAPVLINALAPRMHGNSMADSAISLENMQIAATSLGLGACYINCLHWLTDNKVLREYFEQLGLSKEENIFGSIVVGRPAQPFPKPAPRKDGRLLLIK